MDLEILDFSEETLKMMVMILFLLSVILFLLLICCCLSHLDPFKTFVKKMKPKHYKHNYVNDLPKQLADTEISKVSI